MIDLQVAYDKLAQFETASELANYLKEDGVLATPQSARHCAISVYMKNHTGEQVSTGFGGIRKINNEEGVIIWSLPLTDAMSIFITQFDNADYPDLITPEYKRICKIDD